MTRHVISVTVVLLVAFVAGGALAPVHPTPAVAGQTSPAAGTPCPATTEEENEALVRRYVEEARNRGNVDILDEVLASTAAVDVPVTQLPNPDALKARILEFRSAFPDLHHEIGTVVTEGDYVVATFRRTGTHLGEFDGVPPTGRRAEWSGIHMVRIECGRIVAEWVEANALDLRRDLGIITEDELATVATPAATPAP